jgi:hypothetical protein
MKRIVGVIAVTVLGLTGALVGSGPAQAVTRSDQLRAGQ